MVAQIHVSRTWEQSQGFKWDVAMEQKKIFATPINSFHLLQLFEEIAGFKTN